MKYAAGTDKGLVREKNEDCFDIVECSRGSVCAFIVADGMGGHSCGEIASRMAVEYIRGFFEHNADRYLEADDRGAMLKRLVADANREVWQKSLETPETVGMGTTLTLAVTDGKTADIAHVGDSRLYLVRGGSIRRVTEDHSFIEELVRNGSLTREEAEKHPKKNLITRAVGVAEELEVDTDSLTLEADDIIILCTDGLTNMVCEREIFEIAAGDEPAAACGQLIKTAKKNGGEDNVTVIVIKCE